MNQCATVNTLNYSTIECVEWIHSVVPLSYIFTRTHEQIKWTLSSVKDILFHLRHCRLPWISIDLSKGSCQWAAAVCKVLPVYPVHLFFVFNWDIIHNGEFASIEYTFKVFSSVGFLNHIQHCAAILNLRACSLPRRETPCPSAGTPILPSTLAFLALDNLIFCLWVCRFWRFMWLGSICGLNDWLLRIMVFSRFIHVIPLTSSFFLFMAE